MKRLIALISGRGSNLTAIVEAIERGEVNASVVAVISNRSDAAGLQFAQARGIPTELVSHRDHPTRDAYDRALITCIERHRPDLVVLAGFLRILGDELVQRFAGRMINIHPSLLPIFPGLHSHRRALEAGVKVHGCTVHFVTAALDAGPIIIQAAVPVLDDDDEEALAARVLAAEHRIFPQAIAWYCEERLVTEGTRVRLLGSSDIGRRNELRPMFFVSPETC